jgi:hypothetical protein
MHPMYNLVNNFLKRNMQFTPLHQSITKPLPFARQGQKENKMFCTIIMVFALITLLVSTLLVYGNESTIFFTLTEVSNLIWIVAF